jgi:hypothetical protein
MIGGSMTTLSVYFTGLGTSILITLLIIFYLRKPLADILLDLCRTEKRARFWVHITNLSFVLMTLLLTINQKPKSDQIFVFQLSHYMKSTILGLTLTTVFLSVVIAFFAMVSQKPSMEKVTKE